MNSRWIKYPSMKSQTIKAPERNIEGFFFYIIWGWEGLLRDIKFINRKEKYQQI